MKRELSHISFAHTLYLLNGSDIHSCVFFSFTLKAVMTNTDLLPEYKFKMTPLKARNRIHIS